MTYNLGTRMKVKAPGAKIRDKGARRILRRQSMKLARTRKHVSEINGAQVVTDEDRPTIDSKLMLVQEERLRNRPPKVRGGTWGKKARNP